MKKYLAYISTFVLILGTITLTSCERQSGTEVQSEKKEAIENVLKIGAILPLTGGVAFVGESCRNGIQLAAEQHQKNRPGADRIQLLFEDSANDPKTGLAAYRKLTEVDKTVINLSVMSSVTSALLAQDPTQALLVSVVWYSRITDGHPRTFRYCLSSDKETNAMATYLAARGLKKVAFLYVNDEFGLDAHECFKTHAAQKGLTLAFRESFDKTGADIDGVVTKALTINPEAVYFVGYANSLAIIAKRLNELSYRGVRCSFSSFLVPQVLQQAGTSSEGVLFTSAGYDPMAPVDDVQRRFIDAYQASFSKKPDYYAAFCYDIMNIFLDNWERSGKDLQAALESMKKTRNYPGVVGDATSNEDRDFQFPCKVMVVRDGRAANP